MTPVRNIVDEYIRYWGDRADGLSQLLAQLNGNEDVTDRMNWNGHVTASALVLDADDEKVLFIQSKKFNKLLLPGGHLEKGEATNRAARRELGEETGFGEVTQTIFDSNALIPIEINVHSIAKNDARGEPEHLHYDFIDLFRSRVLKRLLKADPNEAVSVQWCSRDELANAYTLSYQRLALSMEE